MKPGKALYGTFAGPQRGHDNPGDKSDAADPEQHRDHMDSASQNKVIH